MLKLALKTGRSSFLPKKINYISTRWSTSQHRVILIPQIPKDNSETNPILKEYKKGRLDYKEINERHCYFGLGKALLEFETSFNEFETKCKEGNRNFNELFIPMEKAKVQYMSVWNSVNMLMVSTDLLDRDRFVILHARAEKAYNSRLDSIAVYETVKDIYSSQTLTEEQKLILERYKYNYKVQGFELSEDKRGHFRDMYVKELAQIIGDYKYKLKRATDRFNHTIKDAEIVKNFPIDLLKAISADSTQPTKGPWIVSLHPYIYRKFLEYCPNRRMRWNAYLADVNRGSKDFDDYLSLNSEVKSLLEHRADLAIAIGYENYLDMILETKMANHVDNVEAMIFSLLPFAREGQEKELESLQDYAQILGFEDDLCYYDVPYYQRRQREELLGISDEGVRDYFSFPIVLQSLFDLSESHFRIKIEKISDSVSSWSEDVSLYQIKDGSKVLGEFYLDPFIRDSKGFSGPDKGFYFPLKEQSKIADCKPVGSMVLSFPSPAFGKPSLLNYAEVKELYRIFGKALSHLLTDNDWSEFSPHTGTEGDCVDVVPEFMIQWLKDPKYLKSISKHWSTKESLSDNVVQKLCDVHKHMAGYTLSQELFKSAFDIAYYGSSSSKESFLDITERLYPQYLLITREKEDSFPLHFDEMFTRVSPGHYYGSLWSKMIATDVFYALKEAAESNSTERPEDVTYRFRQIFLTNGSRNSMTQNFRRFRGRDPSHEAFLLDLGLKNIAQPKSRSKNI